MKDIQVPTLVQTEMDYKIFISKISCGTGNVLAVAQNKNMDNICFISLNPPTIECGTIEAILDCILFDLFTYFFFTKNEKIKK